MNNKYLKASNIKLRITISVIFLALIIPVFISFIVYSYQTNYLIYKNNAVELITRTNKESIHNLIEFIDPIADAVRVTSQVIADKPELINQDRILEHVIVNLDNNENIISYFISTKDGSFRQVQRVNKASPIANRVPPDGAKYVTWVIDRSQNQTAESNYTFFKSWGDAVEKFSAPAKYDPRTRPFFKGVLKNFNAGQSNVVLLEDPFYTVSTKQPVISASYPIVAGNELIGVVTAQVKVRTFADFLLSSKISKNSETIIFDSSGNIVVHPDVNLGFIKEKETLVPRNIMALENSPATLAKQAHTDDNNNQIEFSFGDKQQDYLAIINPFPADYIKPWKVMTFVPLDDFMGELNNINQRLMIFAVIAFAGVAFLTFYLSKSISKPLENLTLEIQNILSFDNSNIRQVSSPIYEISTLSGSIRKLRSTISAFTSYVPRDLVNELLSSGKKIELGGESRYLTILFSDLADFSSLSEITPSRELLLRVSSYLELMTYAVKEESGTVDKFIGDSVMAFWGAPLLNQNHAYHACVAAVKAQRRMVTLNNQLIIEKKPPLAVRIGIHSDAVLVGNIGSEERLSYTVMGDGVNIASRLEGINKEFGTKVCVSHSLYREAGERLWVRPIDQITVKGRKSELLIYELMGIRDGDAETLPNQTEQDLCTLTYEAFEYYLHGDFEQASLAYDNISKQFKDGLAKVMLHKCELKLKLKQGTA